MLYFGRNAVLLDRNKVTLRCRTCGVTRSRGICPSCGYRDA